MMSMATAQVNAAEFLEICRSMNLAEEDLFDLQEFQLRLNVAQTLRTIMSFANECENLVGSVPLGHGKRAKLKVQKYTINQESLL